MTVFPRQDGRNAPNPWTLTRLITSQSYVHVCGTILLSTHSFDVKGMWLCTHVATCEEAVLKSGWLRVGVLMLPIPIIHAGIRYIDSMKQRLAEVRCEHLQLTTDRDTQWVTSHHL